MHREKICAIFDSFNATKVEGRLSTQNLQDIDVMTFFLLFRESVTVLLEKDNVSCLSSSMSYLKIKQVYLSSN